MKVKKILKDNKLELYVKDIFVLDGSNEKGKNILPFFADGCPGIMFQKAANGAFLHPKNKKLSSFFLYGQTIKPITIKIDGNYLLIVFQLYPFASKALFNIDPKTLKDDCYDINLSGNNSVKPTVHQLLKTNQVNKQIEIIAAFLSKLIQKKAGDKEQKIQLAVNLILNSKGKITVKALTTHLFMTERTLQRQFIDYVGIPPKQFIGIIQFQVSLSQLSGELFSKLTEIVYESGYTDQSHFIKNFKKYTGQKPSQFKKGN